MAMTQEQLEAKKAKAAATRRKTDALRSASLAWSLKDRLTGLEERVPTIFRRSNSIMQDLYKLLYQEHVRMGIDDQGRRFDSEESVAEFGSKIDAEIAYIKSKASFGLKLQKKHYTHLGIAMPTTSNGRVAWKEVTLAEIEELRQHLSEEQVQALLDARTDAVAEAKAAEAAEEAEAA
jgi:hypothetical protein